VFRSLLSTFEELALLILPHGGQRTARRNAWRAATDLHVTSGYRWTDSGGLGPDPVPPIAPRAAGTARPRTTARPRSTARPMVTARPRVPAIPAPARALATHR
jgi:hypothetical protein